MAEVGESSASKPSSQIWAKLVPLNAQYSDIEICSDEMMLSSQISSSSQEKYEWGKIRSNPDLLTAMLQNKSLNDILVDDAVVQKEDIVEIKCGTEIVLGPKREGNLSYRFKLMPGEENCKNKLKISIDVEHAKCSICLNIWHDVITISPCLHNFCNGCFSEWLKRSQKKHSSVLCPQCRAVVQFAGRNHFLRNIEEDILQVDSSLRRSKEEIALLDSYATIRSNLVIGYGRGIQRKRARSLDSEEYDSEESDAGTQCPQCGSEIGGFQCSQQTIHLQCQTCGGLMPSRADINVPQHCLGCDRTFCGAYWHAQRVNRSDLYPVCNYETFRPLPPHDPSVVRNAVNHFLQKNEGDVMVIDVRCVPNDFHARFKAQERTYFYRVLSGPEPLSTFEKERAWHVPEKLDLYAMQEACKILVGHHDFSSFRAAGCQAKSPIRTLDELHVSEVPPTPYFPSITEKDQSNSRLEDSHACSSKPDNVEFGTRRSHRCCVITARARSFLYHQVRLLVGVLKCVGLGELTTSDVERILKAKTVTAAKPMAPACGLYLGRVDYDLPPDS